MNCKCIRQEGRGKIERTLIVIATVLFCMLCMLVGSYLKRNILLSFMVSSNVKDTISVYWYTQDEEIPYSEECMETEIINPNQEKEIEILVPIKSLKYIRIDLGNQSSEWVIENLRLKCGFYEELIEKDFWSVMLGYQNDISSIELLERSALVDTDGNDGYFVLNNLELCLADKTVLYDLTSITVYILACIGIYVYLYWTIKSFINYLKRQNACDSLVKKIRFFVELFNFSFVIAFLFDGIIIRGLCVLFTDSETILSRYFLNGENISLARILFWFIFIALILFCIRVGLETSFKYRYVLALVVFTFLVMGKFHGSSIGYLSGMLNEYTEDYQPSTLLGVNQGLRGDEWAVWTPFKFAQVENEMSYYNNNLMLEGYDTMVGGKLPSYDIMSLTRQKNWGYFFLDLEQAVAFEWWISLFLIFLSGLELMHELTGKKKLSLIYAVVLTFSPCVQWWNSLWVIIYSGQYFLVALSHLLKCTTIRARIGYTILGAVAAISFVFDLYPAWMVPFAYVYLVIGIWLIWKNRKCAILNKGNICSLLFIIGVGIFFSLRFLSLSTNAMETQMSTVYPGAGQWVTVPLDMPLLQIVNFFMADYAYSTILNNCEISQFCSFFIWSFIVWIYYIYKKNKSEQMYLISGLMFLSLFFIYFIYGERIEGLYKVILMSFTYPRRVYTAFGYCTLIVLFLIFNEAIIKIDEKKSRVISTGIGLSVFCCLLANKTILEYLSEEPVIMVLSVLIVEAWCWIGYTILSGKKRNCALIIMMGLVICSTIWVNPINRGLDDFSESCLLQAIKKENQENDKKWMVDGNTTIANMVTACGVERVSGTYIYPDTEMMEIIDSEGKYEQYWNRYAHINMTIGEKNFIQLNPNGSGVEVTIDVETAEKLDIGYIVTCEKAYYSKLDGVQLECIYDDEQWLIYEIQYN